MCFRLRLGLLKPWNEAVTDGETEEIQSSLQSKDVTLASKKNTELAIAL